MKESHTFKFSTYANCLTGILLLFCFGGCTINCPGFSEGSKQWFPYSIKNNLCFVNGNDTLKYEITDYYASPRQSDFFCMCCSRSCDFHATGDNAPYSLINCYMDDEMKFQGVPYIDLDIAYFKSYEFSHFAFNENVNNRYCDSLVVNGKIFYDVLVLNQASFSKGFFQKVIVAKEYGIIEMTDINDKVWELSGE